MLQFFKRHEVNVLYYVEVRSWHKFSNIWRKILALLDCARL